MSTEVLQTDDLTNLEFESYIEEKDYGIFFSKDQYRLEGNVDPIEKGNFYISFSENCDETHWMVTARYIIDKSHWSKDEIDSVMELGGIEYNQINPEDLCVEYDSKCIINLYEMWLSSYTPDRFERSKSFEEMVQIITEAIKTYCQ
ncbi:hypothetical protein LCGC14_0175130 [marine sediment metagenome]|uniref:Uncharacterized protein n=1 Tax=marine sediment metagenome TaxID=412755 RepID=A0A0F9UV76_9ZZZZ